MLQACSVFFAENLETKAAVDLGTKYKSAGTIYHKKFDAPGRKLDLEALWTEKGSEVELAALYKPDTQKKASVKYVSHYLQAATQHALTPNMLLPQKQFLVLHCSS